MRNVTVVAAVLLLACGGSSATRYFRVLFPSSAGATKPDSCYQAATVPTAMTQDELAAENFCRVGKKPSSSSSSMNNVVSSQAWTLVDTDEKLYLLMTSGTTSSGVEGTAMGSTYSFDLQQTTVTKQCAGATGATECNGACVNRQVDPLNCGTCGNACPSGQVCRFGSCSSTMCTTIMQTCNAVQVDLQSDDANCGLCGRVCTAPQVCSAGTCVDACQAQCAKYNRGACGMPRTFSSATDTKIDFELKGGSLNGKVTGTTSFSCMDPGCASDFAARCPACTIETQVFGREVTNVTEFQQR